ncbi:MCE family protein [Nocardioides sp. W3-2-3]|uniref:MlaD family protein n=1 Tax=Nocardioides convexus TaxID=2712224 RepID=UPI0024187624|nr:MlaD family protein [Nocardioides convexus]NGZ99903.1 MCE family protein [Nocardioides convexus]
MKQTNLVVSEITARREAIHRLLLATTDLAKSLNAVVKSTEGKAQPGTAQPQHRHRNAQRAEQADHPRARRDGTRAPLPRQRNRQRPVRAALHQSQEWARSAARRLRSQAPEHPGALLMMRTRDLLRSVGVLLAVAMVLLTSGCGALPNASTTTIKAYLADSAGLFVGNDVGILGVTVGEITSIEPEGDKVLVTMEIDADQPVPADAGAVVVARSVATDRYIEPDAGLPRGQEDGRRCDDRVGQDQDPGRLRPGARRAQRVRHRHWRQQGDDEGRPAVHRRRHQRPAGPRSAVQPDHPLARRRGRRDRGAAGERRRDAEVARHPALDDRGQPGHSADVHPAGLACLVAARRRAGELQDHAARARRGSDHGGEVRGRQPRGDRQGRQRHHDVDEDAAHQAEPGRPSLLRTLPLTLQNLEPDAGQRLAGPAGPAQRPAARQHLGAGVQQRRPQAAVRPPQRDGGRPMSATTLRTTRALLVAVLALALGVMTGCGTTMRDLPIPGTGVSGDTIEVKAQFAEALNLAQGAPVKVNGVDMGRVKEITVDDFTAEATLTLKADAEPARGCSRPAALHHAARRVSSST